MEKYGFGTVLFMMIAGIFFIGISIILLVGIIYGSLGRRNIKNNGVLTNATITYRSVDDDSIFYDIEYIVNGKKYTNAFHANRGTYYNKGDTINIYYLANDPKKVYVPIEKGYGLEAVFIIPIPFILGIICIKNFNVFKYKRVINVN